jgi:hypothetical protein
VSDNSFGHLFEEAASPTQLKLMGGCAMVFDAVATGVAGYITADKPECLMVMSVVGAPLLFGAVGGALALYAHRQP